MMRWNHSTVLYTGAKTNGEMDFHNDNANIKTGDGGDLRSTMGGSRNIKAPYDWNNLHLYSISSFSLLKKVLLTHFKHTCVSF